MRNLKQRLAQANGMNSILCFNAKDRIVSLENALRKCHQAALPDPNDERNISLSWLTSTIHDIYHKAMSFNGK